MKDRVNVKKFTAQFYRGNMGYFLLAMVQTVFLTVTNVLCSWLIQQIADMTTGTDTGFTFMQIVFLSGVCILIIVLTFLFAYLSKPKFISKAVAQYKTYAFGELSKKSIAAFSGENTSFYISALSNDINSIENGYLSNIFVIIDQVAMFAGAFALMLYYSPLLTGISVGLALLPLATSLFTGNLVAKAEKQVSVKNETYISTLKDSLVGFSVIKAFRSESQIRKLFANDVNAVSDAKATRRKKSLIVQMFASTSGSILQLGVFLIGAYLALSGYDISAGTVLVFIQLLNYIINPIATIPQALSECKASHALIGKLANALSENVRDEGTHEKISLEKGITIEKLSFGYDNENTVLNNISFTFEAGKSYCLVGASGSGKSTLLNLLMASYSDYTGRITYDNTEIRDISSESLYDMISPILQNVFIFNSTIRNNITMFGNFPDSDFENAVTMSGLSELIAERGEDFMCGENGCNLSGGEKQRISIARSLLKKSQVLLVDEATASLDAQTAYQVSDSILALQNITRIVITHALDEKLLSRYDCILVLRNGEIKEQGGFDELLDKKGYFYSLYTVSQ